MGIQPDKSDLELGAARPSKVIPARTGVAGALIATAVAGAGLGAGIALVLAPDLIAGAAVGGALTLSAIRVAMLMSSDQRGTGSLNEDETLK